ncbi:hypothetical protein JW752_03220 [Candidatus Peregrinibacteria bacterium]|nr:hypothetical protein [Candidatus Peregrinibacteria bacterium]
MLESPQKNEKSSELAAIREEFLYWLKTPPPWPQLKRIVTDNSGVSFIEEVKEGFRHHLRRGDMKAAERYTAVGIILRGADREAFHQNNFFYDIVREIAKEALADGDADLLNRLQQTYGNGESLLGNDRESIRKTFIISVILLRSRLAEITGAEEWLPSEEEVQKAIEKILINDSD